jgi:hypothetical protein
MTINDLQNLHDKKEWDFILKETKKGYKENRIKREILFSRPLKSQFILSLYENKVEN